MLVSRFLVGNPLYRLPDFSLPGGRKTRSGGIYELGREGVGEGRNSVRQ